MQSTKNLSFDQPVDFEPLIEAVGTPVDMWFLKCTFQKMKPLLILSKQAIIVLRKFSLLHRNLNCLNISNRLKNYIMGTERRRCRNLPFSMTEKNGLLCQTWATQSTCW
jgi:hypothetical protein